MDRLTPNQAIQTAEMALTLARHAKLEEYARLEPAKAELALQSVLEQAGQHTDLKTKALAVRAKELAEAACRVALEKQGFDVARSTAPKNPNKERGRLTNVVQP